MSQPEIPGFYFDTEKRKYFRIQKNHVLPPGSAHTHASVKAKKRADAKKDQESKLAERKRKTLALRSPVLSRLSGVLNLRLGSTPISQAGKTVTSIYARNLTSRRITFDIKDVVPGSANLDPDCHRSFCITDVGCIITSPSRGLHFTGIRPHDTIPEYESLTGISRRQTHQYKGVFSSVQSRRNEGYDQIATANEYFVATNRMLERVTIGRISNNPLVQTRDIELGELQDVADITASRTSSVPTFAMATTNGISLLTLTPSSSIISHRECIKGREQMVVCFKERDILMSGERAGRVYLTDIRSPKATISRLHHSSAISSLCCTKNDFEVLVQGIFTMSIYDLRYTKSQQFPRSIKAPAGHLSPSKPCLNIRVPSDRQSDQYTPGSRKMSYSPDLNLIAAASCHAHAGLLTGDRIKRYHSYNDKINNVTLYSALTGRVVDSPINNFVFENPIWGLEFAKLRGPGGGVSLVTLDHGHHLTEWGERNI